MKTHRISTTISQKHWELLKKHVVKFETQQKVLEFALENLENLESNSKQCMELTAEQKIWRVCESLNTACCIQKDGLKILIETVDLERIKEYVFKNKPIEYLVEFYFKKSLKECSLKEVIVGLIYGARASHFFDTVDYGDGGDHYMLALTHSLGLNGSKLNLITFESMFETYGVNFESSISEKTIFMKIYKN